MGLSVNRFLNSLLMSGLKYLILSEFLFFFFPYAGSWLWSTGSPLWCTGLVAYGMWDLSSLSRDQTYFPCIGRQILNQ